MIDLERTWITMNEHFNENRGYSFAVDHEEVPIVKTFLIENKINFVEDVLPTYSWVYIRKSIWNMFWTAFHTPNFGHFTKALQITFKELR